MTDNNTLIRKIEQVVVSAEQFQDEQFRLILEGLVKRGGKSAELLLVKYITSKDIPIETRINIIRCTGYIQNMMYLVPLKKVIDTEVHMKLKKEAILSLAKYNDRRALNILNSALQSVKNPVLMKTINEKINLIKRNNPMISLLPRFLKGSQDIKTFYVSLDILKKILKPDDAKTFVKYINAGDDLVEKGVFEILCMMADFNLEAPIMEFYFSRANACECLQQAQCDDLFKLTKHLKNYLRRFPGMMDSHFAKAKSLFGQTGDPRVKKLLLSILCRSQQLAVLSFIKEIYGEHKDLRECIIESSAGNNRAVDFLFEKYQSANNLKEKVINALMVSSKGFDYFIKHFSTFEPEHQNMIVRNIPYSDSPQLNTFIENIFNSDNSDLKKNLMVTVRENNLYNLKKYLFDPAKEKEFFSMEDEYLKTIKKVFPVSAAKTLIKRISGEVLPMNEMQDYLTMLDDLSRNELLLKIRSQEEKDTLIQFAKRVVEYNNVHLVLIYLSVLEHVKTFDLNTYRSLQEIFTYCIKSRTSYLTGDEKHAARRVKTNLDNILDEVKKIESIDKDLRIILSKSIPDLNQLRHLLDSRGIALTYKYKGLIAFMVDYFQHMDEKLIAKWRTFFKEYPMVTQLVREARIEAGQTTRNDSDSPEPLVDTIRVVLCFKERENTALFKDQLEEILPNFKIVLDEPSLKKTDLLLCDSDCLTEYIKKKSLATRRIYLLLKDRAEHAQFKEMNLHSFTSPIMVCRVMRALLSDIFLMKA